MGTPPNHHHCPQCLPTSLTTVTNGHHQPQRIAWTLPQQLWHTPRAKMTQQCYITTQSSQTSTWKIHNSAMSLSVMWQTMNDNISHCSSSSFQVSTQRPSPSVPYSHKNKVPCHCCQRHGNQMGATTLVVVYLMDTTTKPHDDHMTRTPPPHYTTTYHHHAKMTPPAPCEDNTTTTMLHHHYMKMMPPPATPQPHHTPIPSTWDNDMPH